MLLFYFVSQNYYIFLIYANILRTFRNKYLFFHKKRAIF